MKGWKMRTLDIKLRNCFGIGELTASFENLDNKRIVLIYAPNGTMKTSFAKTFSAIAHGENPSDQVHPELESQCEVKADGSIMDGGSVFVVNPEGEYDDVGVSVSRFLASSELKQRYDDIRANLQSLYEGLQAELSRVSGGSDCLTEIAKAFGTGSVGENIFVTLTNLRGLLGRSDEQYEFAYAEVFDKNGRIQEFVRKHQDELRDYLDQYQELLSNSTVFKQVGNVQFGTACVNKLKEAVKGNEFFAVGHRLRLNGSDNDVDSVETFERLVKGEHDRIVNDVRLRNIFDKIEKDLNRNDSVRRFKEILTENRWLISKIVNYEGFRKEVLISYLNAVRERYDSVVSEYAERSRELNAVMTMAGEEQDRWNDVIEKFNQRFHVPFEVRIENQRDVLLKSEAASLACYYKDPGFPAVRLSSANNVLSKGEARAWHILQFMFEINVRRDAGGCSLVVLDDVSDSFDYQNKFAIIEYLKDELNADGFRVIILTHNFDFYRTAASRLGNNVIQCYMAMKSTTGRQIVLKDGRYRKDVFVNWLNGCHESSKMLLALIPFFRNMYAYLKGTSSMAYEQLTACLHYKVQGLGVVKRTDDILVDDIIKLYVGCVSRLRSVASTMIAQAGGAGGKYLDWLFLIADGIVNEAEIDPVLLENKVILAMATRMRAEIYVVCLPEFRGAPPMYGHNQLKELICKYEGRFPGRKETIALLKQVGMMTPEQIHLNSFLYEPLIDMGIVDLVELYKKVRALRA